MLNKLKIIAPLLLSTSLFLIGCKSEEYIKEQEQIQKAQAQIKKYKKIASPL